MMDMNRRRFLKTGIALGALGLIPLLRKIGARASTPARPGKRARFFRIYPG